MYILRTMDPTEHEEEWKNYDEITRKELGRILVCPISHSRWVTVALPTSMGAAPMRAAVDHAGAAYAASALGYRNLAGETKDWMMAYSFAVKYLTMVDITNCMIL